MTLYKSRPCRQPVLPFPVRSRSPARDSKQRAEPRAEDIGGGADDVALAIRVRPFVPSFVACACVAGMDDGCSCTNEHGDINVDENDTKNTSNSSWSRFG